MMRRFVAVALFVVAAQGAFAAAQRAQFTRENRFPEVGKVEAGGSYEYREYEYNDLQTLRPYARYTAIDSLTLNASAPYHWSDFENGDSESGLGDARVGLELLAYQDIFEYPWVIPHLDVDLETGDEEEGLGAGETVTTFGISLGTTVYDQLHYVVDISYAINGGSEQTDPDNVVIFAGSIIWDVSEKFAVLAEIKATDEDNPDDDVPYTFQGGLCYSFTEDFTLSCYGGGASTGGASDAEDLIAQVKGSYNF